MTLFSNPDKLHTMIKREFSHQALRIIEKFGGPLQLQHALELIEDPSQARSLASIYKWTYSKTNGGTGGLIPQNALQAVIRAARLSGICITNDDLFGDPDANMPRRARKVNPNPRRILDPERHKP